MQVLNLILRETFKRIEIAALPQKIDRLDNEEVVLRNCQNHATIILQKKFIRTAQQ